jgi:diacylglycerol kinase family enzyme
VRRAPAAPALERPLKRKAVRLLLIVNASASSVTARARVVIQKSLSADHQVQVAETARPGHASRLAQGAAAAGVDVVVVLGGDGTVNEAANGIAGTRAALGVLPGGSTNVYARTIGMSPNPIEATGQLLAAMAGGRDAAREVGVGTVEGRRFLFHVGLGFDAAVVSRVDRRPALKRFAGQALFAYSAIDTWARGYDRRHAHFSLSLRQGDTVREVPGCYFGIVLKSDPYTFLGQRPLNLVRATTVDSALSVVAFRSLGAFDLLSAAALAALGSGATGTPLGYEASSRLRRPPNQMVRARRSLRFSGVDEVLVYPEQPLPYQLDGEYVGTAVKPLVLSWQPNALRLFSPSP